MSTDPLREQIAAAPDGSGRGERAELVVIRCARNAGHADPDRRGAPRGVRFLR